MGNLCCCCPEEENASSRSGSQELNETPQTQLVDYQPQRQDPLTDRDLGAQSAAAAAAEKRQQQFESTPHGRAAYRTEQALKEREASAQGPDTAKDWLS